MTFANNILEVSSYTTQRVFSSCALASLGFQVKNEEAGLCFKFEALEALKLVDSTGEKAVKVAMSDSWLQARQESAHLHQIIHNFDWTYTPYGYKGSLTSAKGETDRFSL